MKLHYGVYETCGHVEMYCVCVYVCVANGMVAHLVNTYPNLVLSFYLYISLLFGCHFGKPTSTNSLTRQSFIHASCTILILPVPQKLMAPSTIYGVQVCIHFFFYFAKFSQPSAALTNLYTHHIYIHHSFATPKI